MNAPFNTPSPRYSEALDWIDSNDSPEATESTRDETLRQIAAHLRDHFGVLRAEAFELMTGWSLANCDAPPQPAEIEQIVKRALSAAQQPLRPSASAAKPDPKPRRYVSKHEAARDHARRGFRVFPLKPYVPMANMKKAVDRAKEPLLPDNWREIATTDLSQIDEWWTRYSDANIGILTDELFVIDDDPRNGGTESFAALCATENLPETLRSKTQGDGYHHIYRQPDGVRVSSSRASQKPIFGKGIDIKAYGGYIVAPGSIIAGREYRWDNDCPIAMAPQRVIDRCESYRPKTPAAGKRLIEENDAAIELAEKSLETAPEAIEGNHGDDTTYRVAATLFDFGVSRATALDMMRGYNETKAFPPWDDADIQRIVASAEINRDEPIGWRNPECSVGFEAFEIDESKKPAAATREPQVPDNDKKDSPLRIIPYDRRPLSAALPRPWFIRGLLCRSQVTALIGPPGSAKSKLMLSGGVALVTGMEDVLGMPIHEKARRVWIYNNEDPEEEMRRRLDAVCQEFDISPPEGQLLLSSGAECPLLIARFVDGRVSRQAVVDELIQEIRARDVDVFMADPVAEFHEAPEENIHMKRVLGIFREIAIKTGCAVWIGAHTRKADRTLARIRPGDLEEWRGGSSQGGVVRLGHTLVKANADDAKQYSFEGRYSDYVRFDAAKNNLGRKEEEPRWFLLKSLPIGMDGADDVGVLRPVSLTNAAPDRLAILAREIKAKFGAERVRVKDVIRGLPSHERILFGTNESHWAREATKAFDGAPEGMTDYGILSHKKTGATSPMTLRLETATTAIRDVAVPENEDVSKT